MRSVTFHTAVGGDGSTVTDDSSPATGLDAGGHRVRFVPALIGLATALGMTSAQLDQLFTTASKL